jgi:hypothetical protein
MMIRALIGLLVIGSCGVTQASPLIHFTLEGRKQGSMDAFASSVDVALGDVIEYRLQLKMAPLGTHNSNGRDPDRRPENHGVNSLSLSIFQDSTDPIQVDFGSPAELRGDSGPSVQDGWYRRVGARGGEPAPRVGLGFHDLLDIRPIHAPGVFSGATEESVLTGAFSVTALTGDQGSVRPQWGPGSGGLWFDGYVFFATAPKLADPFSVYAPGSEAGPDPIAHFTPLTLTAGDFGTVPEPATIVLAGVALVGLGMFRRNKAR